MDTKEYEETHDTNDADCILHEGFYLWPDGSRKLDESWQGIKTLPPDSDSYKKAKSIRFYWQLRLSRAVKAFDELKNGLSQCAATAQREGCPPPSDAQLEKLKELKKEVQHYQKMFNKAEQEVEKMTPIPVKQRREEQQKNRAAGSDFATKLSGITV